MTVVATDRGYLELDYLNQDYGSGEVLGNSGWQFEAVIVDQRKNLGVQAQGQISFLEPLGLQATGVIEDSFAGGFQALASIQDHPDSSGFQAESIVGASPAAGFQALAVVERSAPLGLQFESGITVPYAGGFQFEGHVDTTWARGFEILQTSLIHLQKGKYLIEEDGYLEQPYLGAMIHAVPGLQFLGNLERVPALGWQFEGIINDTTLLGLQTEGRIERETPAGLQALQSIHFEESAGFEAQVQIDRLTAKGWQFQGVIEDTTPLGLQFVAGRESRTGMQFTAVLYNVTNLRVLHDFASRGNGSNWTATSTQPGDFSALNLNTDVVEQIWRSAAGVTSVSLDCDTGIPQGVFMDTLGILNHNISTSAIVTLIGSNNPGHSPAGVSIALGVAVENMIYIEPELPLSGYRYWRIVVDDPTGPGFVSIGTIVFGSSEIFTKNFVQTVGWKLTNFKDLVKTEGYTSVANDRGIKRSLRLEFKNLNYNNGDYQKFTSIFQDIRTMRKALWVPTPQMPNRYAIFSKIVELPEETHNVISDKADYIGFSLDLDESQ